MARARNIKPSIMDNEELAALDPTTRLLFIYLWMLADREGRLEDRPKRIAAQALAYDRTADADKMLDELQSAGFIVRYAAGSVACIQIVSFAKHQSPHVREAASTLPAQVHDTTKAVHEHNLGDVKASPRSPDSLIPSSLIPSSLIPSSSVPVGTGGESPPASQAEQESQNPMTAKDRVWAFGPGLIGGSDGPARGLLGKLVAAHGEGVVDEVLSACADVQPGERKGWITAACIRRGKVSAHVGGIAAGPVDDSRPDWAIGAGFPTRFDAGNAGCWQHNAAEFSDGQRRNAGAQHDH